jgi:hypothetical protein
MVRPTHVPRPEPDHNHPFLVRMKRTPDYSPSLAFRYRIFSGIHLAWFDPRDVTGLGNRYVLEAHAGNFQKVPTAGKSYAVRIKAHSAASPRNNSSSTSVLASSSPSFSAFRSGSFALPWWTKHSDTFPRTRDRPRPSLPSRHIRLTPARLLLLPLFPGPRRNATGFLVTQMTEMQAPPSQFSVNLFPHSVNYLIVSFTFAPSSLILGQDFFSALIFGPLGWPGLSRGIRGRSRIIEG